MTKTVNEIHVLAAAAFSDTAIQIPAGATVSKVTVRVIDAVVISGAGPQTFDVGVVGALTRYGAGLAGAAGTERDQGPSDNQLFYGPAAAIRLSAPGVETFTAGKISVAITHSAPKEGQTGIVAASAPAKIKSGTYTGDDTTSQPITGVGFRPKYVRIWKQSLVQAQIAVFETTTDIVDDNAAGAAIFIAALGGNPNVKLLFNKIISLDADGFTVDDNGINDDPNIAGQIYNYLAIG